MKTFSLLLLGLLLGSAGCNRHRTTTEPCPSPEIAGRRPLLYPCVPRSDSASARLFVINSVAEYQAAFPCAATLPSPASLADSTLLVGWKNYCCCGHVKSQRLLYACESDTYTYQVEIEAGVCAAAMPVTSAWRVPKLPAGASVALDMK